MRCPVCRAEIAEGPNCRRCRADLSLLFALEAERQAALHRALAALGGSDARDAHFEARGAEWLRADEQSARCLALTSLVCRDFLGAYHNYCLAQQRAG